MEDYIELSLMLQYKVIFSIMWKSLSNTATLYIGILAMREGGSSTTNECHVLAYFTVDWSSCAELGFKKDRVLAS